MLVLIGIFAVLLGSTFGSFAGVVASRGLRQSLGGRSHCDSCDRTLAWFELVPLVSYVALRRRCRTCHAMVAWSVLGWESGGAALALAIALPVALSQGL